MEYELKKKKKFPSNSRTSTKKKKKFKLLLLFFFWGTINTNPTSPSTETKAFKKITKFSFSPEKKKKWRDYSFSISSVSQNLSPIFSVSMLPIANCFAAPSSFLAVIPQETIVAVGSMDLTEKEFVYQ